MTTGSKVYTINILKIGIYNIVAKDPDKNSIPQPPNSLTSSIPNFYPTLHHFKTLALEHPRGRTPLSNFPAPLPLQVGTEF